MRAMRVKVTSHLTLSTISTSLLTRPQPVSSTDGKIERRLCSKLSSNFSTKIENERFVYLVMGDGTGLALLGRTMRMKCISPEFCRHQFDVEPEKTAECGVQSVYLLFRTTEPSSRSLAFFTSFSHFPSIIEIFTPL